MGLLNKNPYTWMGLGLLTAGTLVSPVAYFILDLTWLSALGICMLILSLILLALGRTIPKLPPEACGLLLETGVDNMAALIEELGIRAKATYLPSSLTNGRPQAFIPLHSNPALPSITTALPQRLIVRYGSGPDDVGLLISTIGTNAVSLLESKPGPSSIELESTLTSLFSGILGVADRTVVVCNEKHIKVEIHNPHLENGTGWAHHCWGGPLASVAAAVAAEAWDRPVTIEQEEQNGSKYSVELEVKE